MVTIVTVQGPSGEATLIGSVCEPGIPLLLKPDSLQTEPPRGGFYGLRIGDWRSGILDSEL